MSKSKKQTVKKAKKGLTLESYKSARLLLAGYVLILLILQLFTFENFPQLLTGIGLSLVLAKILAVILVVAELLTFPFLIGIEKLPRLITKLSLVSTFVALALLTAIESFAMFTGRTVFTGATLDLPSGSWSLLFLMALWVLAIWGVFGNYGKKQKTSDQS